MNTQFGRLVIVAALLGAAAPLAGQTSLKVDPSWMTVKTSESSVEFRIIAGPTPVNSGMNFNGANAGGLQLTVPLKWRVTLHFSNADENMPHSVIVTKLELPVPGNPSKPAFAGSESKDAMSGVNVGSKQDVRFTVDQAGTYMIVCGVPGHGTAGMWIRLVVSATATAPTMTAVAAAP